VDPDHRRVALLEPGVLRDTSSCNWPDRPRLTVSPRRYRLRLLNAANARTLFLKVVTDPLAARPARARVPFWIIGSTAVCFRRGAVVCIDFRYVHRFFDSATHRTTGTLPRAPSCSMINRGPGKTTRTAAAVINVRTTTRTTRRPPAR